MTQDLEKIAKDKGIRYFLISFTDLFGVMRSKLVPTSAIAGMQKSGAGFAGFAAHLDLTPADADMFAVPDPETMIQLPWKKEVAWVAANPMINGQELSHAPRNILRAQIAKASAQNMQLKTGVECEFLLLDETGTKVGDPKDTQSKPCYDQIALMRHYDLISRICDYMHDLGWEPYQNDHEDGNGQFEMNWGYDDALITADRHAFFKFMVRTLAEEQGLRATFMPKPFTELTGNGCHVHFSLWQGNKNIFHDPAGELGLSQTAYHFLGGVLNNAEALCAFTNPTVNSFKRLNAPTTLSGSTWSPNTISYSGNNRTHMVRIPDNDRFELRLPDGATNPYLLPASVLAAGLNGMANKTDPGKRQNHNEYDSDKKLKKLPSTLIEALGELEKSKMFNEAFGKEVVQSFVKLKTAEWKKINSHIAPAERDLYLDV